MQPIQRPHNNLINSHSGNFISNNQVHQPSEAKNFNIRVKEVALPILKGICFFVGGSLGVFTGMALTVGLASPIGPAIAGGVLALGLAGSLVCGGKRELMKTLAFTVAGYCYGYFFGGIVGAMAVEQAIVNVGTNMGLTDYALAAFVTKQMPFMVHYVVPFTAMPSFLLPPCINALVVYGMEEDRRNQGAIPPKM
ncbi:MAG: hypothetical protein H0X29_10230 [Parachlamydiaceae bacterium]|nr:hypothetical protein [Parachlamydiaceae bacterium]